MQIQIAITRLVSSRRVAESLRQWRELLWPHRCCLCAQHGLGGMDLCRYCLALGWRNTAACLRCALPLWQINERPNGLKGMAQAHEPFCGSCWDKHDSSLQAVHAAWLYAPPFDALVKRYKFSGDLAAGRVLAQLMSSAKPAWIQSDHILVPVPLHRKRLRERGHDQSRELVRQLAKMTGLAWTDALKREVATSAQSTLSLEKRRKNLAGAFSAVKPLRGTFVLIDDVMTSGATLEAAAQALRDGGAQQVCAWVVARTPRPAGAMQKPLPVVSSIRGDAHAAAGR